MKYYSEELDKFYDNENECMEAERINKERVAREQEEKKQKEIEQASRLEEVLAAINTANELIDKYLKDYKTISLKGCGDLWTWLF